MPTTHLDGATYGVEFECYLPDGAQQRACAEAVAHRLGVRCEVQTYNHRPSGCWKIVPDGSLQDFTRGIELVSPILRGEEGLRLIERAAEALSDFGCTVAKRCGFHVHVGAGDRHLPMMKNLIKLYGTFEPVIDSMMPNSRRASASMFARSLTSVSPTAVDRAADLATLILISTPGAPITERRYFKVNLEAYSRHRTVEFRQHSGTLQATKARAWAEICLRMVAAARRSDLPLNTAPTSVNQARAGSKAHTIGQMMLRPEGATAREVCVAMNWPSVSMPAQARMCGLAYTTQRTGREVRYFAVAATAATTSVEVTIAGFANVIGATQSERGYIEQRTNDLRGPIAWAA